MVMCCRLSDVVVFEEISLESSQETWVVCFGGGKKCCLCMKRDKLNWKLSVSADVWKKKIPPSRYQYESLETSLLYILNIWQDFYCNLFHIAIYSRWATDYSVSPVWSDSGCPGVSK